MRQPSSHPPQEHHITYLYRRHYQHPAVARYQWMRQLHAPECARCDKKAYHAVPPVPVEVEAGGTEKGTGVEATGGTSGVASTPVPPVASGTSEVASTPVPPVASLFQWPPPLQYTSSTVEWSPVPPVDWPPVLVASALVPEATENGTASSTSAEAIEKGTGGTGTGVRRY